VTDSVERELELPAPLDRVWRSLTEADLLAEWLADDVTLELWPGGEASFRFGSEERGGWVEEVDPPDTDSERAARLTFWWAPDGGAASRVALTLIPTERGTTRLRITETRPLEILDLVGMPLPGYGRTNYGPALVAA
jgi:uncharacterized protein YndB with AHSA1/START domain